MAFILWWHIRKWFLFYAHWLKIEAAGSIRHMRAVPRAVPCYLTFDQVKTRSSSKKTFKSGLSPLGEKHAQYLKHLQ